jgi:hypothetical protein
MMEDNMFAGIDVSKNWVYIWKCTTISFALCQMLHALLQLRNHTP